MRRHTTPLLVGVDVGTTTIKAAVYEPDGRVVGQASTTTVTHVPRPHWAFYRAGEVWDLTVKTLRGAIARIDDPGRIASVAVASMGEAGVPLDAAGDPTSDVIAWFDTRPQQEAAWLDREIGRDALFAATGLSLQPIFGLCKVLWLRNHETEAFARTVRWLNVADYIAYRLSGVPATDHSLASRTLAFNLHQREWDRQILSIVGLGPEFHAPLVPSGTALGPVTGAASTATGLPRSAIVAAGGHDHVCGALATGVTRPGSMLNSLGTAEAVFLPLESPVSDPGLGRQGYTQGAHVVPGRYYLFGGQYTSGASIAWVRELVGGNWSYSELIASASDVPVGSLGVCFLPHLRLANPPFDDPQARGAFIGLTADVTRETLARAVLEGLAYETRISLEGALQFEGVSGPSDIIAIGGGTRNPLLLRIKATVLRKALRVSGLQEATTLGAAMLGGIGAGVYRNADAAIASVSSEQAAVDPVSEWADLYDQVYTDIYRRLYQTLRPLHHAIHHIEMGTERDPDSSVPDAAGKAWDAPTP